MSDPRSVSPAAALAHLDGAIWAGDLAAFHRLRAALGDTRLGLFDDGDRPARARLRVDASGTARIPVSGIIDERYADAYRWWGISATKPSEVEELVQNALDDSRVSAIRLEVDSPGGVISGVAGLADSIHAARGSKPITAHASNVMASAAYWIGAQADRISADATTEVGSIGVYRVLVDSSQYYTERGIKVDVVRSSPLKGTGVEGDRITDAQRSVEQEQIDKAAELFTESIRRGRNMSASAAADVSTGRCWWADDAKALGLIDVVGPLGSADNHLEPRATARANTRTPTPSAEARGEEQRMADKAESDRAEAQLRGDLARVQQETSALRTERDTALASRDAAVAALVEAKKGVTAGIILAAQNAGKLTPALLVIAQQLDASSKHDANAVTQFCDALPVQTRAQPISQGATAQASSSATDDDAQIATAFGLSKEAMAKGARDVKVSMFGKQKGGGS